jgi:transposase
MLLPVDLREWIAQDDLAHFVLEALETLELSSAVLNETGSGSEQYPPGMMLAVLIYCYANGIFSSRKIERATYQHLSVRFLSGDTHPDHDSLCTFRRRNGPLLEKAFVHVLMLAREMGMLQLGTVSLDGTKIQAAAAKQRSLKYCDLQKELAELEKKAQEHLQEAEKTDQGETADRDRLPKELAERRTRQARLQEAKARLEARQQARSAEREKQREKARAQGEHPPKKIPSEPSTQSSYNTTDPDSELMPTRREGWVQGYNAQLVVAAESSLVVATEVCTQVTDRQQLAPMVEKIPVEAGPVIHILADTGYDNQSQRQQVEKTAGRTVLCPPQNVPEQPRNKRPKEYEKRIKQARQEMVERLKTAQGKALYALREKTIEPVIGIIKSVLGFRRFSVRGLKHVRTEWLLVCLAYNLRKMSLCRA